MIASFFDGRVRLRDRALCDSETMALVRGLIEGQDGVREVHANATTGSLLVLYDPGIISRAMLMQAAATLQEHLAGQQKTVQPARMKRKRPLSRRQESLVLAGAHALTLGSLAAGARFHAWAGALLTILSAYHLYTRRNCLFPSGKTGEERDADCAC